MCLTRLGSCCKVGYKLYVVHLKMLVDELVLVVLISVRVVLHMDYLEKKCLLMVGDCLYL